MVFVCDVTLFTMVGVVLWKLDYVKEPGFLEASPLYDSGLELAKRGACVRTVMQKASSSHYSW